MRNFKIGDRVVRTIERDTDESVGDDFFSKIGDIAIIESLSKNYDDAYNVKIIKGYLKEGQKKIWEEQNCRLESKLEKALK